MLTNLVFFLILISGSAYAAIRFGKRFEETMPISVMGIVLILFTFGLMGILEVGMIALYALAVGFYLLASVLIYQKIENWGGIKHLLTPGFIFFLISYIFLAWRNNGKLAYDLDEFSHWVDIVKTATYLGDFGTNPASNSLFASYPPGMMLFQYSLQKVHLLFHPDAVFSEWRTIFALQVFHVAIMLPFFRRLPFKQPLRLALFAAITFLAPMLFYREYYQDVSIDPTLGVLFGSGMAAVLLQNEKNAYRNVYICMICAMLTLCKDVGFLLALAVAVAFGLTQLVDTKQQLKYRLRNAMSAVAAAWVPKLLWSWEVKSSGAAVAFENKLQWDMLWAVITGKDTSYRTEVLHKYWNALFTKQIWFGKIPLSLNYISLTLVFFAALLLLWWLNKKEHPEIAKQQGLTFLIAAVTLVGYTIGLCVIYLYKFTEYEATRLASMQRYLNIPFLGVWMLIIWGFAQWICQRRSKRTAGILMLIMLIFVALVAPYSKFIGFVRGDYIQEGINERAPYEPLKEEIQQHCDGDDRIYFISQKDGIFDYLVSKFNARPNSFSGAYSWRIGEADEDENDSTRIITPAAWRNELLEQYDYVALYKIDDYFVENYGQLFAEPDAILINKLYRVNRQSGLLEQCK